MALLGADRITEPGGPVSRAGIKTSLTHPLRIAELSPRGISGTIGMMLCPGLCGPALGGGDWHRDLAPDLAVVRGWRPDIVLALLEETELRTLGLPDFHCAVRSADLPWEFLPIRDRGIPDDAFARRWSVVGPSVRAILRGGGRVLVHCRSGLGRTGTIVASLLAELGTAPQAAIDAVRAARPYAIQTQEQEAYVRARRPAGP